MSEEQEQKRGFKVEDRRRFDESGDARETAGDAAAAEPRTVPPREPPAGPTVASQAESSRPTAQAATSPELTFTTFLLSLSTQALAHLGEIPSLMDGQMSKDLVAAKQLIDIIGILSDKTKGNLDAGETALMQSILYDLRLKYVELTRRAT